MREKTIGIAFLVATIGGALLGGLLAAFWWDFGPYDEFSILSPRATVILYSVVGGFVAFVLTGPVLAVIGVALALRDRHRRRRQDITQS